MVFSFLFVGLSSETLTELTDNAICNYLSRDVQSLLLTHEVSTVTTLVYPVTTNVATPH